MTTLVQVVVGLLMLAGGTVWIRSAVGRLKALNVKIEGYKAQAATAEAESAAINARMMADLEAQHARLAAQVDTPEARAQKVEQARVRDLAEETRAADARALREATEARLAEISGTPHPE